MRTKKIFIILIALFIIFIPISRADDESTSIDISALSTNFNNSSYVAKLKNLGVKVSATQSGNLIMLQYNDSDFVTYYYNESTRLLSTSYPLKDSTNSDILNAIFIDTISTMQGNPEGSQIMTALTDDFCYNSVEYNGLEKSYSTSSDGSYVANFQINPNFTFALPNVTSSISKNSFLEQDGAFYTTEDYLVKDAGLIFYRTYSDDGKLELYIGQPDELNECAYSSILTAVSILFEEENSTQLNEKASAYFSQNYSGFENGNAEFDGVSIEIGLEALPISNVDTVLVDSDMKYAKITIDSDIVKEKLPEVVITSPEAGDSTSNNSKNRVSAIINVSIGLVILVIAIMVIGYIGRRHSNKS